MLSGLTLKPDRLMTSGMTLPGMSNPQKVHSPSVRVFYWDLDKAKFSKGPWKRGKVIAVNGPMVTIEHDGGVSRINESKLRKDHDPWRDNPLPPILEEGRMLNPAGKRPPAEPPPGIPAREDEQ